MKTKPLLIPFFSLLLLTISSCENAPSASKEDSELPFQYSICEPLNPTVLEMGGIEKEEVLHIFQIFPWEMYLEEMNRAVSESQIYYSPSLEIKNRATQKGITCSAVGLPSNYQFHVFYRIPKPNTLGEQEEDFEILYLVNQTEEEAKAHLKALSEGREQYLEEIFEKEGQSIKE